MSKFLTTLLIGIITSDKVKAMISDLLRKLVREEFLPLLPVLSASTAKAAVDQIVAKFPELKDAVDGAVDIVHIADQARDTLNALIPDIDFPIIGDLTDFWRPKS